MTVAQRIPELQIASRYTTRIVANEFVEAPPEKSFLLCPMSPLGAAREIGRVLSEEATSYFKPGI